MKHILEFIEKHKGFFKKLAIIAIFALVTGLLNNPTLEAVLYQLFGSELGLSSAKAVISGLSLATAID